VDFVINGLDKGTLKPAIDRVFPFAKIVDAHHYLANRQDRRHDLIQRKRESAIYSNLTGK
jgi:NADPH:quinone reductase-like Zn-dependent oxidoreductase